MAKVIIYLEIENPYPRREDIYQYIMDLCEDETLDYFLED